MEHRVRMVDTNAPPPPSTLSSSPGGEPDIPAAPSRL